MLAYLHLGVLEYRKLQFGKDAFGTQYSTTPLLHFPNSFLLDQLELARPPGLVDPGLQRTVGPQENEPALAGYGLDPVLLHSFRRFRGKNDVYGTIRILFLVSA